MMFGTYNPDGVLELDHCLCIAADDGAGGPRFENGQLVVPSEPGLGIEVNDAAAAKFRV